MIRSAAVALLLCLGGCSGLLHSSASLEQVYYLRATTRPAPADTARPATAASVHVGRPIAAPGLDSSHIVLLESDRRMSYFMASRWPGPLPEVVEELASQVLRASAAWSTVQSSESPFPSDYMLQIRIRHFEADYSSAGPGPGPAGSVRSGSGAPEAHVVLDCTIGRRAGREIVGTFVVEGSAVAAANRLADVVAALEEATNQALTSMAAQAVEAVREANQKVDRPVPSMNR